MDTDLITSIRGLMQSPLDFSDFFDKLPIGIAVLDLELRIVLVNQSMEGITGYSSNEARGIPVRHIIRSDKCVSRYLLNSKICKKTPMSLKSDIINKDRQKIPVGISVAPLMDSSGNVCGYMETLEKIMDGKKDDMALNKAYSFSDIIGRSPQMEKIFQTIPVLAQSDSSILITGETGTGKDLVAEAIHKTSTRAKGPFIKINCGALPETLLESEIFGHRKGAFTGAVENKPGRFQLAHNGTIFLTEIGDLPLPLQVKLLTFLDDKVVYPLGSTRGFKADVRIITATHRDLETMVREKKFRQDLFFRLNVARIHLPPLRKREGDLRLLTDHFVNFFSKKLNKSRSRLTSQAMTVLSAYHYAGNIRELRNIIEYAVNLAGDKPIEPEHLPAYLFENRFEQADPGDKKSSEAGSFIPPEAPGRTWASTEREMIIDAMVKARGRKKDAAALLGWGRSTLWRKMKLHGIK